MTDSYRPRGHRIDEPKIWAACPNCAKMKAVVEAAKEALNIVGWVVATSSTFGAYPSVAQEVHDKLRAALRALREGKV